MRIVYISVNSTDAKTMVQPMREFKERESIDVDLFCGNGNEFDDDPILYQDLVRATKMADLVLMRCMSDPSKFNRFERYEEVLRDAPGLVFLYSGNHDVKLLYRDLFKGTDEEYIELGRYVAFRGNENDLGIAYWLNRRIGTKELNVPEPMKNREDGIYHPDHDRDVSFEDYISTLGPGRMTVGIMFTGGLWIYNNTEHIDALIRALESRGMNVIPVFFSVAISSTGIEEAGTAAISRRYFMDGGRSRIDVLIMSSPFSQLVNSRDSQGMATPDDENFYRNMMNVPVLQAMNVGGRFLDFEESTDGLNKSEIYSQVSWPEVDGQIITVPISMTSDGSRGIRRNIPLNDRIEHLAEIARNWAILRNTPPSERRIAILLYQSSPDSGRIGSAAGLDTIESVWSILNRMQDAGYDVGEVPETPKGLIGEMLDGITNNLEWTPSDIVRKRSIGLVDANDYLKDFEQILEFNRKGMEESWGKPPGEVLVDDGRIVIPGIVKGNVMIGYQPLRGWFEQMEAVYHDPLLVTTHQYLEYYRWIKNEFKANMVVHVGTHGTLEWLPGKTVGLSGKCYPDLILDSIPHMYPYVIDDPGEGIQAKRRSEAVLIGHMCPTMARAGDYDDLSPVDSLLQEYFRFKDAMSDERRSTLISQMHEEVRKADLYNDLSIEGNPTDEEFEPYLAHLHDYLTEVKDALIRDGLHVLGKVPEGRRMEESIYSLTRLRNGDVPSLRTALAETMGLDIERAMESPTEASGSGLLNSLLIEEVDGELQGLISHMASSGYDAGSCLDWVAERHGRCSDDLKRSVGYACGTVAPNLMRMGDEVRHLLDGFDGRYVPPGPSGAPTRGNADILPMGRNYYGVDPSMVPSRAAWVTGVKMAEQMVSRYIDEKGEHPREVGFIIWATDTMKTSGDDVAYILWLMGVRPVWSILGGQVIDLEVVPLEELKRPRIDVTVRITGLFRDTFPNLIDMLDDAVKLVADLSESEEENYLAANLRRDIIEALEKGVAIDEARRRASVRIFGCPPGAYGPGVNHAIESGEWKTVQDLADIYITWGSHAYGRGINGESMRDEFVNRFSKVGVTIKNMPDREIDLLDIDDVYGYLGGLNAFVKTYGRQDALSFMGDSSDPDKVKLRDTKEEMRFVFRSKVLNPKFLNGLKEHGYRGVSELAKMTEYMLGWDATSDAIDDWMYEKVAEKFLLDEDTKEWMMDENPYSMMDMLNRLQEAIERGLWDASDDMKERLMGLFSDVEERVEEITDR